MFQLLVGLMVRNTDKLGREAIDLGAVYTRFKKRKWYLPFLNTEYCEFRYKERVITMRLDDVYRIEHNTKLMDWLYETIKIAKSEVE